MSLILNSITISKMFLNGIELDKAYLNGVQFFSKTQPLTFNSGTEVKNIGPETSAERIIYCGNGKYICGTEGNAKIYTSSDYGATWTDRGSLGSGATVVFGLGYLENGIALAGTAPNGDLFRTTDYGVTWSLISYGKTASANDLRGIAYAGSGVVCIGNEQIDGADLTRGSKFYRSTDYGVNWTEVFYSNDTDGMFGCYTMDYVGNNNFVAMIGNGGNGGPYTDQGHIIHSSDNGNTWTTVESNIDSYAAYCSANDGSGTCYMPFSGGSQPNDADSLIIFKSTDYGATWTKITQFFTGTDALNGLVHLGNNDWLIGTDNKNNIDGCSVYYSSDGCETWTKEYDLSGPDDDYRTYAIATDENKNLIFGVFKFSGEGKIWKASYQ